MPRKPQTRIGISGWTYAPWRGVFYPEELTIKRELEYASRQFNSIEINGSFYSLQTPASYRKWHDVTPDDFVFAMKGPRYITHMRRLVDVAAPLANFFASGLLALGSKLGPILWQFPPNFRYDADKLERFFRLLPRDTADAARLARKHDAKVSGRSVLRAPEEMALRHAIEIRHPSFANAEFIQLLRRHRICFVFADAAGLYPYGEDITADFLYLRLHGAEELYASGYTDSALDHWASRIRLWRRGKEPADAIHWSPKKARPRAARDVYIYFDNDKKVRAPFDARSLTRRLGEDSR